MCIHQYDKGFFLWRGQQSGIVSQYPNVPARDRAPVLPKIEFVFCFVVSVVVNGFLSFLFFFFFWGGGGGGEGGGHGGGCAFLS